MAGTSTSVAYVRTLIWCVVGVGLLLLIITHSLVAYLASVDPATALGIRRDPVALLNHVERRLEILMTETRAVTAPAPGLSPNDASPPQPAPDRLRAWADLGSRAAQPTVGTQRPQSEIAEERRALRVIVREALAKDPLSARGFRMLAQIEEGDGATKEDVAKYMRIAASRSVHEATAIWWLLLYALEQSDTTAILTLADTILRTNSRLTAPAVQAINQVAASDAGMTQLIALLKGQPPWRSRFLSAWPQYITDARLPLTVLLALRDTSRPPTSAELREYMAVLLRNNLFGLAYYTWLQFMPPEQLKSVTSVFNGGFELTPSGLPFDWIIGKGQGVIAGIIPKPGSRSERVLSVEFGIGRVEFPGVTQTILLTEGSYRFEASYRAQIVGRRGLVWQITCFDGGQTVLGNSTMMLSEGSEWKRIEFDFKVPASNCPAQQLRLYHDARSASEQLVSGWSMHDDIAVVRRDDP